MKYEYPVEAGRKFGHLTVLETNLKQEIKNNPGHFQTVARCVCDCGSGKEVMVTPSLLRNGLVSSCGCLRAPKTKVGDRSGDLEVVKCGYTKGRKGNMRQMVLCKCHRCGGEIELFESVFRRQKPQSCNCKKSVSVKIGDRLGKLEVVGFAGQDEMGNHLLRCKCDCGKERVVTVSKWNQKQVFSCGCVKRTPVIEEWSVEKVFGKHPPLPVGTRVGHLVVLDGAVVRQHAAFARCKCDCGNEIEVSHSELRRGKIKSCGCGGRVPIGSVFGRLTVIDNSLVGHNHKGTFAMAKCVCSCPAHNEIIVPQNSLKRGNTRSCGCLAIENVLKHGDSRSPLYRIWTGIRVRCRDVNAPFAENYVLKGVRVADEWQDWLVFKEWALTHGYREGLTIDRIDNDGNYCPENCRWVTQAEQNRNKSDNVKITFNGETMCIAEWARRLDMNETTLSKRIRKWGVERAMTENLHKEKQRR